MTYIHRTINLATGEQTDTPYTQAEIDEVIASEARQAAKADFTAQAEAAKAAAQAKLSALGLTTDDLKALGL